MLVVQSCFQKGVCSEYGEAYHRVGNNRVCLCVWRTNASGHDCCDSDQSQKRWGSSRLGAEQPKRNSPSRLDRRHQAGGYDFGDRSWYRSWYLRSLTCPAFFRRHTTSGWGPQDPTLMPRNYTWAFSFN